MPSKRKPHPLESLTFEAPAPAPQPTSAAPQATPAPNAPPAQTEEPTRSSNVTLPVSVWEWIDRKHAEARSRGGAPIRKAAILRAVFAVAMSAEADIAGALSEEEIAELIIRAIVLEHSKTYVQ
jgi:hypothetical protein